MTGMIRGTYILGWLCFLLAMILRVAALSRDLGLKMGEVNVVPRNFLALSFLFFVMCIASDVYHRAQQK